jgi:hypothetical protein
MFPYPALLLKGVINLEPARFPVIFPQGKG